MDEFQNEIEPALLLAMYSNEELGIKITTEKNPSDPPDHYATIDDKNKVNLELTQLAEYTLHEKNSFLNSIDELLNQFINKYVNKLPDGKYSAFYELGETVLKDGWKFMAPNQKKIAKSTLTKEIEKCVKNLVINFSGHSKSCSIKNKKNEQIGIIHLNRKSNHEKPMVYIIPQLMQVRDTTKEYVFSEIQNRIETKEIKYNGKYDSEKDKWWLLIHDLMNYLNADFFIDDLRKKEFKFEFFDKVLFIRKSFGGYKITDLKKAT